MREWKRLDLTRPDTIAKLCDAISETGNFYAICAKSTGNETVFCDIGCFVATEEHGYLWSSSVSRLFSTSLKKLSEWYPRIWYTPVPPFDGV